MQWSARRRFWRAVEAAQRLIDVPEESSFLAREQKHHRDWIADEVLASAITFGDEVQVNAHMLARQSVNLDGVHADLALTKD